MDGGYILAGQGNLSGSGDVYVVKTEPEFAAFVVTPTGLDFGDVSIGLSKSDSVQVTNAGNGAILNITSVVSDNEVFAVTPATGSVNPAQSMQFYITFTPIDPGAVIGNIIFVHNAAASPDTVTVAGNGVVGIDETRSYSIPSCYGLTQNYPNPFKVETGIRYQLPRSGVVTIAIYNVSGQRVRTLVEEHADAGYYAV
ncbi:T9SS type A sorting domain-containing protein, partial [candidate division WOR-3 bacterium]|nr:T9SS type A sorting domain-containing protein [candidate division WOR-3 bacterium]